MERKRKQKTKERKLGQEYFLYSASTQQKGSQARNQWLTPIILAT
jgi:hypothetical protein